MEFKIRNLFQCENTMEELEELDLNVAPYDYDKFRNMRIVKFDSEKELRNFMKEAMKTIKLVGYNHSCYFTDVCLVPVTGKQYWEIRISYLAYD